MATVSCLVTTMLQNIFCTQQKKETHKDLEQIWRFLRKKIRDAWQMKICALKSAQNIKHFWYPPTGWNQSLKLENHSLCSLIHYTIFWEICQFRLPKICRLPLTFSSSVVYSSFLLMCQADASWICFIKLHLYCPKYCVVLVAILVSSSKKS